jgi:putative NIF3 family GTP cyclohydrolase 1 type 2
MITKSVALPNPLNTLYGAGRICQVSGPLTLGQAIDKIKAHTGLPDVRVAIAAAGSIDSPIRSFGVCAGSGASVLKDIKAPIDLFISGELSHHDCLDAIHRQIHVITLNHSNSERKYLNFPSIGCECSKN